MGRFAYYSFDELPHAQVSGARTRWRRGDDTVEDRSQEVPLGLSEHLIADGHIIQFLLLTCLYLNLDYRGIMGRTMCEGYCAEWCIS